MAIRYYTDQTNYRFTQRRLISSWLKLAAKGEGYDVGDINIIFTSSKRLLEINREYLSHDYFTDIITFDDSDLESGYICGELYIDVETVEDNAKELGVAPLCEMHRIIVHGVLHLCGQGDKSPEDNKTMHAKEDRALELLEELKSNASR
ncbi:MAG: rRNA maturation RNase YbeY [Rikenellaceae bacterium]